MVLLNQNVAYYRYCLAGCTANFPTICNILTLAIKKINRTGKLQNQLFLVIWQELVTFAIQIVYFVMLTTYVFFSLG